MNNNFYMPLHPGDYLTDTAHLSLTEHGAYMMLIMNYWQTGKPLPVDDRKLRGIARMTADEWGHSRELLLEFFTEDAGLLHHKRIDAELARVAERSSAARARAELSHSARKAGAKRPHSVGIAHAQPEHSARSAYQAQDQEQDQKKEKTAAPPRRASELRRTCSDLVGQEPVLTATDFDAAVEAAKAEGLTDEDFIEGVRAAMADPTFRPRRWGQMVGWARGAKADRLGSRPKTTGKRRGDAATETPKFSYAGALAEHERQKESRHGQRPDAENGENDAGPVIEGRHG